MGKTRSKTEVRGQASQRSGRSCLRWSGRLRSWLTLNPHTQKPAYAPPNSLHEPVGHPLGDSVQTFYTTVSGTTRIVLPVR